VYSWYRNKLVFPVLQNAIMDSLRVRLKELDKADRFKATNAFSEPSKSGAPTHNTTGRSQAPTTAPGPASSSHRDAIYHSRHYALPSERPIGAVYVPRPPEDIENLIWSAIEEDSQLIPSGMNDLPEGLGDPDGTQEAGMSGASILTVNAENRP